MEDACPGCGYISDRPSRFCRQCGKQLYVETEASSAATRNYEPNRVPTPRQPDTPHYNPGPGMNPGMNEETSRFYQPPIAPYPDFPEKKKSRTGMWILVAVLCFMMVSVGVAAIVVFTLRPHRQVTIGDRDIDRLRELGKIPPPPPPPFSPADAAKTELPDVFARYKYPNAQVDHLVSAVGNDIVKLSTADKVGTVRDFYSKVTDSSPLVRSRKEEKEEVIFQADSPPILIIISPDDDLPGKTQIVLIHSVFQIPR
jgi:hypothetical protein